ncbi:Protein CBG18515 [Caenorhabditis briggsae]|uniref:Protein CBG18515 n=1 Tax=Caenorhabditis briggsae TaxID=6238 RepID=A8XTH1_CAEBR|nr:Protein CBG18515 [Caenorhabditis briggsae]CAP35948.1 Protein CBG18515 [Caenorhabditis briggsae]
MSEDVVMCFKYCANRCDYTIFIAEYESFLNAISELLKPASFPKEFECNFVSMHLKLFVEFLRNRDQPNDSDWPALLYLERNVPELLHDMKYSILKGTWDPFYWKYRSKFDYMIQKSRNQKVIDFQIQCNGDCFESFKLRDFAFNFKKSNADYMPPYINTALRTPLKSNNKGNVSNELGKTPVKRENNELGRCKAHTNFQSKTARVIFTPASLPEKIWLFSDMYNIWSNILILKEAMAGSGSAKARFARQCIFTACIGIKKNMIRRMIEKERMEMKKDFIQRLELITQYQNKLEELKSLVLGMFLQENDNTEIIEKSQNCIESMKARLELKKEELDEETSERESYLFIEEQLGGSENEERMDSENSNINPSSVAGSVESSSCECPTCTMNLVWNKIDENQTASESVSENNQKKLEQLQQLLILTKEMKNERDEKMIEGLKKDKEERNMKVDELLSEIDSKLQTGEPG